MSFDDYMKQMRTIKNASATYTCFCGSKSPLEELFFCCAKTCQTFICHSCTNQVIDTYYCPSCLNSFFSSTAFQNKNKCQQCRKCPVCFCTLGHVTLPNGEFIFRCEYCKWRSDDIGLKAKSIKDLFNLIREKDQTQQGEKTFTELIKVYGDKFKKARAYDRRFHYDPDMENEEDTEKKKRTFSDDDEFRNGDSQEAAKKSDAILEARRKELWRLPEENTENPFQEYKEDKSLDEIPNLEQRFTDLRCIPVDSAKTSAMWPHGVNLQTKVGHKCPRCTRFVLKPKAGATKVTYDVSLLAMLLFPRVTISVDFEQPSQGKKTQVVIALRNPCQAAIIVSFSPLPEPPPEKEDSDDEGDDSAAEDGAEKKLCPPEPPVVYGDDIQTAKVVLPNGEFTLDAFNPVTEQQSLVSEKTIVSKDAGGVVAYKHLSKLGLNFFVTPKNGVGDVVFSFMVTVKPAEKGPETSKFIPYDEFTYQATINLGKVSTDSCSL